MKALTANPPTRPANMDDLLRLNREGVDIPASITAQQAIARVAAGGAGSIVDVRTGAEFDGEHVPGSVLIPLDQLAQHVDQIRALPAPRLLMCRTGRRALSAQDILTKLGVSGTQVVDGGIVAYGAGGGATEKGRDVMSLERQVRIVAGLLVFAGTMLGIFVSPWFLAIPAFVGAGLTFAGITDTCGMAMLLAKMPWNRASASDASPTSGGCAATLPSGGCAATPPPTGGGCAATLPE